MGVRCTLLTELSVIEQFYKKKTCILQPGGIIYGVTILLLFLLFLLLLKETKKIKSDSFSSPPHPPLPGGRLCFESRRTGASFANRAGAKGFAFKSLHTDKPAVQPSGESRWGLWAWGRGRAEEGRCAGGKECPLLYRSISSTLHCGLNTHRVERAPCLEKVLNFPLVSSEEPFEFPIQQPEKMIGLLRWC